MRAVDDAIRQAAAEGDETALEILALEGEDLQSAGPEPGGVVTNGKRQKNTDRVISRQRARTTENPILSKIGVPSFLMGDGRRYDRQTGWGKNKVKHPDGGTNETAAFVVFSPFAGTNITLEGRIYCERFMESGKAIRSYSVSLPFLKADRKDNDGRNAVEQVKATIRDLYRVWAASPDAKAQVEKAVKSSDRWVEADE